MLTAVIVDRLIELPDQALIAHAVYTYLVRYVPVPPIGANGWETLSTVCSNWGIITILLKPPVWSLVVSAED